MRPVVIVPSPLVGPATWQPVADRLRVQSREVVVVETGAPHHPDEVVAAVVRTARGLGPLTLVAHSNAGRLVPRLSELLDVDAAIYVDAALAGPEPETAMAAPDLLEVLRGLADPQGVLPRWSDWWAEEDVGDLWPDDETRVLVERGQPRLSLSYFTGTVPVPDGWTTRAAAYVAFGDTYAEELLLARSAGWPTTRLEGGHLHQLHDPGLVTAEILRLEAQLLTTGP